MSSKLYPPVVAIAAICLMTPAHGLALPAPPPAEQSSAKAASLETGVPLYRFFRGFRKPDLTPAQYIADLQARFIPAAPATHAKNGLVAYLPAVPFEGKVTWGMAFNLRFARRSPND